MTFAVVSLVFEAVVSALLIAVIVYAVRLNQRLAGLREHEVELQDLITRFNEASSRAEASAATLRSVGTEAERSLRTTVERAQAVRDDLSFLAQRGDRAADLAAERAAVRDRGPGAAREASPSATVATTRMAEESLDALGSRVAARSPQPVAAGADEPDETTPDSMESRSEAERELLHALRSAKQGG